MTDRAGSLIQIGTGTAVGAVGVIVGAGIAISACSTPTATPDTGQSLNTVQVQDYIDTNYPGWNWHCKVFTHDTPVAASMQVVCK